MFVAPSLIAATPDPTACSSPAPPIPEQHHRSGLVLLPPLPRCIPPPFEPLAKPSSDAHMLAEAYPEAFGYPWSDQAKRELVVSVVNADGERTARAWMAGGATIISGTKTALLPPPTVPVRLRTVTRSVAQLLKLEDEIVAFTRAGMTDASAIHMFGSDDEHDRIVIEVDHLTDELATALATRFGTAAIAVRVDPLSTNVTSLAADLDDGQDRGRYVVGAVALGLVAIGVVVTLWRRARGRGSPQG